MSLIRYHETNSRILLSKGTMKNYGATEKYIQKFLQYKYRVDDIRLINLNYQFITQFELFLRTTTPLNESNPLANNGVMKHKERLRKIVTIGFKLEWIPSLGEKYFTDFQLSDESQYWETGDEKIAGENFKLYDDLLDKVSNAFENFPIKDDETIQAYFEGVLRWVHWK
jgi:hypothetical protein